eukprot:UN25095
MCEYVRFFFMGRLFPSNRSLISLIVIVLGALSYVMNDKQFGVEGIGGYFWVFVWFFALCFNMTYGKHILNKVKKKNIWESVYYN